MSLVNNNENVTNTIPSKNFFFSDENKKMRYWDPLDLVNETMTTK